MRVYYEPKVILVARPTLVMEGIREVLEEYDIVSTEGEKYAEDVMGNGNIKGWLREGFTDHSGIHDGDGLPEFMGRLCYGSFGDRQGRIGATEYHANILGSGHGSVLEHANWSFVIVRASRGFTHQMVRHRAGFAFSQESQHFIRYSTEGEKGAPQAAVCLTGMPNNETADFLAGACKAAVDTYAELWHRIRETFPEDAKVKKIVSGTARGMLPTALESRLGFTANARALRHFCELRGNPDNILEIRLVAAQVVYIMKKEAPALFQDFAVGIDADSYPTVKSGHHKV